MSASCHVDRFVLDNLPPADLLPDFVNLDRLGYPEMLNATVDLVGRHVAEGRGDNTALRAPGGVRWSYAELARTIDRMANALTQKLGLVPGARVLLRSANNPTKVALYMAIIKAGGIVVAGCGEERQGQGDDGRRESRLHEASDESREDDVRDILPILTEPERRKFHESVVDVRGRRRPAVRPRRVGVPRPRRRLRLAQEIPRPRIGRVEHPLPQRRCL